jgi:hypothetical protein
VETTRYECTVPEANGNRTVGLQANPANRVERPRCRGVDGEPHLYSSLPNDPRIAASDPLGHASTLRSATRDRRVAAPEISLGSACRLHALVRRLPLQAVDLSANAFDRINQFLAGFDRKSTCADKAVDLIHKRAKLVASGLRVLGSKIPSVIDPAW